MMDINVQISDSAIKAKFNSIPGKVNSSLQKTIYTIVEKLRTHIVQDKLLGQVLNRRTGRLGQSIQTKVESSPTSITGIVYSAGDVKYAAIHEFGGRTSPHIIEPKTAQALYFNGRFAKRVNHPGSNIPERSYMRSSLADMADEIKQRLQAAIAEGIA